MMAPYRKHVYFIDLIRGDLRYITSMHHANLTFALDYSNPLVVRIS
jgi:hypothetical protein